MPDTSSPEYSPTIDDEFWVELEVPYELYLENWDEDHKHQLINLVESNGGVLKRHLEPYWDLTQPGNIPKKKAAIEDLASDKPEWAAALLSAYQFNKNTNEEHVLSRLSQVSIDDDDVLQKHVDTATSNSDKKFAIILLDMLSPERLKDIYVLSQLRRTTPTTTYEVTDTNDPLEDLEQTELLEELQDESREFNVWHKFKSNGSSYLVIKIHREDGVQVQPETNEAVEEAEYLILKATDSRVQVYTPEKNLLGATQRGIRNGVEAGKDDVDDCSVTATDNTASPKEYKDAIDDISSGNIGTNLVLDKITVENAPLGGSPKIKISDGAGGIIDALDELESAGVDLLKDPDNVHQISFSFNDRVYDLYPEVDGTDIKIRYNGSINDDSLLDDFEKEIQKQFDLPLTLEKK